MSNLQRRKRASRRKRSIFGEVLTAGLFLGIVAVVASWLSSRNAEQISGNAYVVDGDSLIIAQRKLRLVGIDAPEFNQLCQRRGVDWPCGRESRNALRNLVAGLQVECSFGETDRYDRPLVKCETGGKELNASMVRQGWAVDYGGYGSEEGEARKAGRGIWSGEFMHPVDWRREYGSNERRVVQRGDDGANSIYARFHSAVKQGWVELKNLYYSF